MSLPTPDDLPDLRWNNCLHEIGYFLLYFAPVTGFPVFVAVGLAFGSFATANAVWLGSFAVPVLTAVYRSHLKRARKRVYARYYEGCQFLSALQERCFYSSNVPLDPARLAPEAAATVTRVKALLESFPPIDYHGMSITDAFPAWERQFNTLIATLDPNRSPVQPLSVIPDKFYQRIRQQDATYRESANITAAAYCTMRLGLRVILLRYPPSLLSPRMRAVHQDLSAELERFSIVRPLCDPRVIDDAAHHNLPPETVYDRILTYTRELYTNPNWTPDLEAHNRHHEILAECPLLSRYFPIREDPAPAARYLAAVLDAFDTDAREQMCAAHTFILGHPLNLPALPAAIRPSVLPLSSSERHTHTYVIGRTGSGKTTLLKHLIAQDLRNPQQGVIVISPENKISHSPGFSGKIPSH